MNECQDDQNTQDSTKGKGVVGSRRYMNQLYFDGMAICANIGFPDLFITFTCNPNWPEIQRIHPPMKLQPNDRPDLISRVFKINVDELMADLTETNFRKGCCL